MRIISTLPTATEIIFALGLGDQLVGVSHECNYPKEVRAIPKISSTDFNYSNATSLAIHNEVKKSAHQHKSLYILNEVLLQRLKPTHLITQQLCDVCAITPLDIQIVFKKLKQLPEILIINATSLQQICDAVRNLGKALNSEIRGETLAKQLEKKLFSLNEKTKKIKRKTVFCAEWLEPLFATGHWIPEMVELAGGNEVLGLKDNPSREVTSQELVEKNPEILILMPCGFSPKRIITELTHIQKLQYWEYLKAVKNNQIWVVDGPSYFNQSGPRVITKGIDILSKIIHPEKFGNPTKKEAKRIFL